MDGVARSADQTDTDGGAGQRYLLLADISGYTGFMTGVELEHGADFSAGIPAAYSILAALLDSVIRGIEPDFDLVKLEGDAVFAAAPAARLDGHGDRVLGEIGTMYRAFVDSRTLGTSCRSRRARGRRGRRAGLPARPRRVHHPRA